MLQLHAYPLSLSMGDRNSEESEDSTENIAQNLVPILESEATTFILMSTIRQVKSHKSGFWRQDSRCSVKR